MYKEKLIGTTSYEDKKTRKKEHNTKQTQEAQGQGTLQTYNPPHQCDPVLCMSNQLQDYVQGS